MADTNDLARIQSEPERPEFMTLEEAAVTFLEMQRVLKSGGVPLYSAVLSAMDLERELRNNITNVVESFSMTMLSPSRQEFISEHLFRRLGDLSTTIDNLRVIAEDIHNTDIARIIERYEGKP